MGNIVKNFNEFVNEGIDKEQILSLNDTYPEIITGIKDAYYGVNDHLSNLVEYLKDAEDEDGAWKEEVKIWEQIAKLESKSKIGKFL